ncbi:MAG: ATP phosphoribosyltransferase regulatory subunit [Pseudomonadales bacterium]|nr:ATP phosphoribosyltransferase regulatory subunit [Pseudomonadales bacterium]
MTTLNNWRLPDGVDELLPPAAWSLELVRRRVLDVFRSWGFEYVEPPVIEYLESLRVGSGSDLDLQTLKVVDQRSGRLLGVRADMTSQAARIDAHSLPGDGVRRLCYAGTVVHANPAGVLDSRVPEKAGAEIFGAASLAADAEVVALLLEVLRVNEVASSVLVLGHMGIYQSLTAPLSLPQDVERELFAAVQNKSETDIAGLLGRRTETQHLVRLPMLMGRHDQLADARRALAGAPPGVEQALDALEWLAARVAALHAPVDLRFDLAELAGYGYHNGPVFSAYQPAQGGAIARGGRYDGIGAAFGRARPATGFDVSLKQLLRPVRAAASAIWAPCLAGPDSAEQSVALSARIRALRAAGETVISALDPGEAPPATCDRILTLADGAWAVRPI